MPALFEPLPETGQHRIRSAILAFGLALVLALGYSAIRPAQGRAGVTDPSLASHLKKMAALLDDRRLALDIDGTVRTVVDFVLGSAAEQADQAPCRYTGAPTAYYAVDFRCRLTQVLRIGFNPDIPSVLSSPASIRWSRWEAIPGRSDDLTRLARTRLPVKAPMEFRAAEFVENTPDENSGAYHNYVTDRLFLLFSDRGRDVLISLSRQRGPSKIGKKGMILGADNDWTYLYSDEQGLSLAGLGWIRSQIYTSHSVAVYVDTGTRVRCGVFQWMRAGWSGLNMVRSKHIYAGLKRYAETFRAVLEHPRLPSPQRMASVYAKIRQLPEKDLRAWFEQYLTRLETGNSRKNRRWINRHLRSAPNPAAVAREPLESRLALEWLKQVLGKTDKAGLGALTLVLEPGRH